MTETTLDQTNTDPIRQTRGVLWLLPFAALVLIFIPTLAGLVSQWFTDDNYSHGFLIPFISGWLIYRQRKSLASIPWTIDSLGLAAIVVGLALFIVGNGAAEYFTVRLSFVLTLIGLIVYLCGRQFAKAIWFPLFFLLFMIPVPYVLYYAATFPMQTLATKITVAALSFIGLDVVRQGNIIHIANYSLEVAEACSGLRSLVSLLALGAIYAYLTQRRLWAQIVLFLSTIPIAIAANVFRVFATALIVATISDGVTKEPVHSLMGLTVFVVSFILLFIVGGILRAATK